MSLPTLRLPASPSRRRPPELTYAADERPPIGALAVLGAQHAATTMAFIAYVLVAARTAGLERAATQGVVAVTLLAMALATALQAWGGRWGSGLLLVHQPCPFMIPIIAAAMALGGPGALVGITLVFAVTSLAVAPLVRHLRPLFPPPVVGAVICMGGIALVAPSVRQALGVDAGHWVIDGASAWIAGVTLGGIVVLTVWGGRLRLMALLLSLAAGVVLAALFGRLEGTEALKGVAVLALPSWHTPVLGLNAGLVAATVLVAVLTQLDTLGCVTIMDKMDDADWKRADMRAISGGIRAGGLGDLCAGLLGSFPTAVCSANIALAYATRATARRIGLLTAALMAAAAFLPQLTMALTLIPEPVLGAVGLYAACFLMVSGMELAMSRAIDSRIVFAIGISLCAGVATLQLPQLSAHAPAALHFLLGDGFVLAGLSVVALNLLFRLGTSQRARLTLHAGSATLHTDITGFIESRGAAWGARRNVVQRAAQAALEAVEAVQSAGKGRRGLELRGHFDEFNLDLELLHTGAPLPMGAAASATPLHAALLESGDESAINAALAQVSGLLLRHLADRVSTATEGENALLRLHFEH